LFLVANLLDYKIETHKLISGYEVVDRACCSTGRFEMGYLCSDKSPLTCKDAEKYVFWDAFHPTEKTNRIVSTFLVSKLKANFK